MEIFREHLSDALRASPSRSRSRTAPAPPVLTADALGVPVWRKRATSEGASLRGPSLIDIRQAQVMAVRRCTGGGFGEEHLTAVEPRVYGPESASAAEPSWNGSRIALAGTAGDVQRQGTEGNAGKQTLVTEAQKILSAPACSLEELEEFRRAANG